MQTTAIGKALIKSEIDIKKTIFIPKVNQFNFLLAINIFKIRKIPKRLNIQHNKVIIISVFSKDIFF